MNIKGEWLKHVRAHLVIAFPRDRGLYRRKFISQEQYLTACDYAYRNRLELFTSVLSDYEIKNQIVSCIFYDIDVDYDVLDLVNKLQPIIEKVRTVYSGRRGLHLYIDLKPVKVCDLRRASKHVAEFLGVLDFVDRQTLGDWRRISRVPYSYHGVTGNMCTVLNGTTDAELSEILSEMLSMKFKVKENYEIYTPLQPPEIVYCNGEPPPCVTFLLGQLMSGYNLTHAARLHIGSFLMKLGLTPEEACIIFSNVPDFSREYTLYQLRWLRDRNYNMYSCVRAKEYGLCPLPMNICKYYPTPNSFFR